MAFGPISEHDAETTVQELQQLASQAEERRDWKLVRKLLRAIAQAQRACSASHAGETTASAVGAEGPVEA